MKITADSLGKALGYEVMQNMDVRPDSPKRNNLRINWLKKMNFKGLCKNHGYTIDNCYVTDRVDEIVFITRNDELINGISWIDGLDIGKAAAGPYAQFIKNCNITFDRIQDRH